MDLWRRSFPPVLSVTSPDAGISVGDVPTRAVRDRGSPVRLRVPVNEVADHAHARPIEDLSCSLDRRESVRVGRHETLGESDE